MSVITFHTVSACGLIITEWIKMSGHKNFSIKQSPLREDLQNAGFKYRKNVSSLAISNLLF